MVSEEILIYRKHGGRIKEIKYDFSVNTNPLGPPPIVYKILKDNLNLIKYYPEEESKSLKLLYGEKHGINPSDIIIGNGASELIFLFISTIKPKRIILPVPSFSEYYIASSTIKRELIMPLYIKQKEKFSPPLGRIIESISPGSLLIIGHPNNPTGMIYNKDEIIEIAERSLSMKGYVMIDEAFADFSEEIYLAENLIEKYPNLFILRSFTKIFSIPGIRLGLGIGNPFIIKKMESRRDPWSVNIFAQLIGEKLLYEEEFIEETKRYITKERNFIYEYLKGIKAIEVFDSHTNFYLLRFPNTSSKEVIKFLMENDIYVRNGSDFIGLQDGFIRIAIKTQDENKLLLNCIKIFLNNLQLG